MTTKITTIDDKREGRLLAAAIKRHFLIEARVTGAAGAFEIVTDDELVGGAGLKRIRSYAAGWKDSLAAAR